MKEVISADDFSDAMDLTDDMTAAATAQGGTLAAVYQAQSGGQPIGYAINVESSGSQGTISMMVGIDMDGAVTGVSIVTNSETSGIGSKVMGNEPLTNGTGVLDQFIGKSAADGTLAVGTNVDAITGATVSSKGVTTGVNTCLLYTSRPVPDLAQGHQLADSCGLHRHRGCSDRAVPQGRRR